MVKLELLIPEKSTLKNRVPEVVSIAAFPFKIPFRNLGCADPVDCVAFLLFPLWSCHELRKAPSMLEDVPASAFSHTARPADTPPGDCACVCTVRSKILEKKNRC